jgi:hypothetical protein
MYDALMRAIFQSRSPTDISNIAKDYEIDDIVVDSPYLGLDLYMLKANAEIKPMDAKYEHRPDLVSYEAYKTPSLWYIILLVNNVTLEDFNKRVLPEIIIPNIYTVKYMLNKVKTGGTTI